MEKDKIIKHIATLVEKEVAYFNGWHVSHEAMEGDCKKAAENIFRYLRRSRHLTPAVPDSEDGAIWMWPCPKCGKGWKIKANAIECCR